MFDKDELIDSITSSYVSISNEAVSHSQNLHDKINKYDFYKYIRDNSSISTAAKKRVAAELSRKKIKSGTAIRKLEMETISEERKIEEEDDEKIKTRKEIK